MLQCMKKTVDAKTNIPSDKNKLIIMLAKRTGQKSSKKRLSGLLLSPYGAHCKYH